jgi:hypothetical protein
MKFRTLKLFYYCAARPICSTVLPISSIVSIIGLSTTDDIVDPALVIWSLAHRLVKYGYVCCEYVLIDKHVKKYSKLNYTLSIGELYNTKRVMNIVAGRSISL